MAEKKKLKKPGWIEEFKLQNNECEVDELKSYTTRSLTLLRFCKEKLFETDKEVKKILEELGD